MNDIQTVFLVTAYRHGDFSDYNYLVGIYSDAERAMNAAQAEDEYRGGKYSCRVVEQELNGPEMQVLKECESPL